MVSKNCTFDVFLSRVYEVLQINPNDYSITLKTTLQSRCSTQPVCSIPMDIVDDLMVRVLIHMSSNSVNEGCIPVFVSKFLKVRNQEHVEEENVVTLAAVEEEVLPLTTSLQQGYSPFHYNDDRINDTNNTTANSINIDSCHTLIADGDDDFGYAPLDDDDNHLDNTCDYGDDGDEDDEDDGDDGGDGDDEHDEHDEDLVGDREDLPHFENCHDLRRSRPVIPRPHSKGVEVDPLVSIAPVLPSDLVAPDFVRHIGCNDICVGKLFDSKYNLMLELRKVSLRDKFDFKVARSTSTHFEAHCTSISCKWHLRAKRASNEENVRWVVMRCDDIHTCRNEPRGLRQARSRVIGHSITDKFIQEKRIYTPNDIIADIQQEYNIRLSYQQAYRAREFALEVIRGSPSKSYNLLSKYSHVLEKENEGTVTALKLDGNNNFLYYFVGSCINGFLQSIRSVIAVDGTHLKGLYRETMFVATCLDGNNQLYPLAIGIGDSENNDSWEWFVMNLHGVIGDIPDLVIISDRSNSIQRAVMKIFRSATHDICFYHVKGNVKSKFRMSKAFWDKFEPAFINAAKEYRYEEFRTQLEGLWGMHSGVADYLENNVGTCNWARSQFDGRRYSILTTNIAESLNSLMREPQKFPITHLVDHFRKTLHQ